MKKVVYITGCAGFIGSEITYQFLKEKFYVIGVDKMTYASNSNNIDIFKKLYPNSFKFIEKDINDLTFLYDCDYVINLAAESHVDNSIISAKEFIHSNINGVHNLLELVKTKNKFKLPVFIQFSTDETYGDIVKGSHTESDPLKPSNPYSATKASADMLVLSYGRTHKIPYIIVRPTNNYGIGQYPEKLIPKTCKCFFLDKKIPLHNGGLPKRTYLHIEDTSNAILQIIKCNVVNEIYNISGNYEIRNIDLVEKLAKLWFKEKFTSVNDYCDFSYSRDGVDVRYSLDDSKLKSLGWYPIAHFDSTLEDIVKEHKSKFIW